MKLAAKNLTKTLPQHPPSSGHAKNEGEVGQKGSMNVGQQGEAEIGNAVPYVQNDGSGCIERNLGRS
jgi:hypothetical protein